MYQNQKTTMNQKQHDLLGVGICHELKKQNQSSFRVCHHGIR